MAIAFKAYALKLGQSIKYESSINEIKRAAQAIFDFQKKSYSKDKFWRGGKINCAQLAKAVDSRKQTVWKNESDLEPNDSGNHSTRRCRWAIPSPESQKI